MRKRIILVAVVSAVAAFGLVPTAFGSVLIARSATDVHVRVVRDNHALKALVFYKRGGQQNILLAWAPSMPVLIRSAGSSTAPCAGRARWR